ncbi:mannose-1-phosphate guanylyltransferase/mannose-6-phosphate isomerase [Parazoarcus communis]|uniref:mannose-1-phosphate guanylyltransferase n=1 Tax=Parazoarcus communis SWub3 = DSM 12120 TaxID=1121029 RepID=A0A323UTJ8_9RHOO|nr:mannose-1-phosphate guanylyltransferase/mannose-6-phosphate isomerase [Parazoarcus communis]NMG70632.1 mannose-1-phosphate guanylyltransferase/mannose-6-phosphate isomerase [Parazoarcus communis SWub3 = DSM 12120]PZA15717.1 mannose-1-phosphate guanylyltransferase/mannose-6-phosphate isomerase [Azoarcus communis] [Parazoarcus communis SWub3 = DSM 12120]
MTIKMVVLSGGSGTRLWPASRESYPKQLLPLTSAYSLLQETVVRLKGFSGGEVDAQPLIVSNEEYRFIIAEQLRQVGVRSAQIVLEPVGRNTAPALTLAALAAAQDGQDPVLLVMPADHVIVDLPAFQQAIAEGAAQAGAGRLVTFGIVPDRAETGYGYIRVGPLAGDARTARVLAEFVEKPDVATAARYVASGEYFWNSGIFMMKASVWLAAVKHFRADIAQACEMAFEGRQADADFLRVDKAAFAACPSDSIDYAVMEKLQSAPALGQGVVVPLSAGWSDVGAWDALWAVSDKDEDGNAGRGEVMFQSSRNTLVHANNRLVAAVGCEDMVVVETADAVMVAHKSRTQDVKKVVERLKAEGRTLTQSHRKVYRPWGWYDSIDSGERFQVKRIVVNPGATLSLQMHHHRAEHWIVVKGTAEVTNGEQVFLLGENESTYIPLGHTHRLANPGKVPLEIIEVQSGSYLGEDDIVRFEDTYGRVGK